MSGNGTSAPIAVAELTALVDRVRATGQAVNDAIVQHRAAEESFRKSEDTLKIARDHFAQARGALLSAAIGEVEA